MPKVQSNFRCTECGWTTLKWVGRCGECQQWGTVVEAGTTTGILHAVKAVRITDARLARPITEIDTESVAHWPSGIAEFDRVLGGGIVPGAAILLSGEPGVGKSTLLLEVASRAARGGMRVLYVSAEESVSQVRLRAERTGALQPTLYLAAETDLATILGQIDAGRPAARHRRLGADRVELAHRRARRRPGPGARGRIHPHPRLQRPQPARAARRPRHQRRHDRRARGCSSTSWMSCCSSRATGRPRCASCARTRTASDRRMRSAASR